MRSHIYEYIYSPMYSPMWHVAQEVEWVGW